MSLLAEYSFDAGAGSTVADSSGNGHDLALPTGARAEWVAGKNGGGLSGGTAAYANHDATANGAYGNALTWFPFSGSWTVALWAKIPTSDGRPVWSISQDASGSLQFSMVSTNSQTWFYWLGSGSPFQTTGNYADNAWHHWAWTYDASTKTSGFYVDGSPAPMQGYPPISGTNLTGTWTAAQLAIVGIPYAGSSAGGTANSTVDDFRIFNTALSQSDVQTWMNTPAGVPASASYAATGVAQVLSGSSGVISASRPVGGVAIALSSAAGSVGITQGARAYVIAGAISASSSVAGSVTTRKAVSGEVPASTVVAGAPTYATPTRDIDVTAGPTRTEWQVMGTTAYPIATGPTNADNGYSAGGVTVGAWAAATLVNQWAAGPVWIQE